MGAFFDAVAAHEGRPLALGVVNAKQRSVRTITVVPRRGWGGDGLLGLGVKLGSFERAMENVVRVLSVQPGSPAERAGLRTGGVDFLLGTPDVVFFDLDDFFDFVSDVAEV